MTWTGSSGCADQPRSVLQCPPPQPKPRTPPWSAGQSSCSCAAAEQQGRARVEDATAGEDECPIGVHTCRSGRLPAPLAVAILALRGSTQSLLEAKSFSPGLSAAPTHYFIYSCGRPSGRTGRPVQRYHVIILLYCPSTAARATTWATTEGRVDLSYSQLALGT